jgi:hypothetical protein
MIGAEVKSRHANAALIIDPDGGPIKISEQ